MEVLGAWRDHYDRAAFIDLQIADATATRQRARTEAESRQWTFDPMVGSNRLIKRLIDADWDESDYLILRPGERLAMSFDEGVIQSTSAEGPRPD